jgi:hypothetical protein
LHQLARRVECDRIADDYGDIHRGAKMADIEGLIFRGNMPHRRNCRLDDKDVNACFLRDSAEALSLLGN